MAIELLAATTSATASAEFEFFRGEALPVMVATNGLGANEYATLQFHNGVDWTDYQPEGETTPRRITSDNAPLHIWPTAGRFRMHKIATVAAVSLHLFTERNNTTA